MIKFYTLNGTEVHVNAKNIRYLIRCGDGAEICFSENDTIEVPDTIEEVLAKLSGHVTKDFTRSGEYDTL